jgi:soluble lytic murein transglycosylase-like protein
LGHLHAFRARKPRVAPRGTPAARQIEAENGDTPLTVWGVLIRLLPVWALIVVVLLTEPSLPLHAFDSALSGLSRLGSSATATPRPEPIFIVEAATGVAVPGDLPAPNWSLDIAPVFTPQVQHWKESIGQWSLTYRIKPNLIATLMQIESCGNPQAISGANAQGLFQVIPSNFVAGENPFDVETNAHVGLSLYAQAMAGANGDVGLAFAAYNGGPVIFTMSPSEWSKQTQIYQYWGSGIYDEAERSLKQSPTLQDWLDGGGSDLCKAATQALGPAP